MPPPSTYCSGHYFRQCQLQADAKKVCRVSTSSQSTFSDASEQRKNRGQHIYKLCKLTSLISYLSFLLSFLTIVSQSVPTQRDAPFVGKNIFLLGLFSRFTNTWGGEEIFEHKCLSNSKILPTQHASINYLPTHPPTHLPTHLTYHTVLEKCDQIELFLKGFGRQFFSTKLRGPHSWVDSSTPSILPPRVRVPSTPLMVLSIYIWFVLCRKDEINKKMPDSGPNILLILGLAGK